MLLNSADIATIADEITNVRNNRSITKSLLRDGVHLPPQTFRFERSSSYSNPETDGAEERRADGVLNGEIDADVRVDDKFVEHGELFRIRYIHPNRRVHTQCDLEMVAAAWPDYIYLTDDTGAFVTDEYGAPIVGL